MRILLVLAILLGGCATKPIDLSINTSQVVGKPEPSVMTEQLLDMPFGANISGVDGDDDCSEAYRIAEEGIIDSLPPDRTPKDVDRALVDDHRLIGIWYADTGWCLVYDIADIELQPGSHSAHDQFWYNLDAVETAGHLLVETAHNKYNRPFIKVFDCPLCL